MEPHKQCKKNNSERFIIFHGKEIGWDSGCI